MKKSINLVQGLSIVVGMIIGSGIFLKPAIVLKDAGNPIMALAAWILGGIITLASALTIAEIASNIPRAGGLYTYLEELYVPHPIVGAIDKNPPQGTILVDEKSNEKSNGRN